MKDMHDKILDAGRLIHQEQKMSREAIIGAFKYSSKESQNAYVDGFIRGANFVVSDFISTFGKSEIHTEAIIKE